MTHVALDRASWELYELLVHERDACGRHFKITFDRGTMLIGEPPKAVNESLKSTMRSVVEISALERNIVLGSYGSTTWRRKTLLSGIEADESYFIGREPGLELNDDYDLQREPMPDLVIDVDVAGHPQERLSVYAAFGVSEVWRAGRTVEVLRLDHNSERYKAQALSIVLPFVGTADLDRFVGIHMSGGQMEARSAIREWARSLPR